MSHAFEDVFWISNNGKREKLYAILNFKMLNGFSEK
jgi:hypothetical protein